MFQYGITQSNYCRLNQPKNEEFKTEKSFQTFTTNISKTDKFEALNVLKSMRSRIGSFSLCKQILHQQQIECK